MKIALGQPNRKRGWHTIDIYGDPLQKWDLNKGLPKNIKEATEITCGHTLEHLTYKGAMKLLDDIARILKGTLTIDVPDMEGLCKEYLEATTQEHIHTVLTYIYGNQERKGQFHQWGWDRITLPRELTKRGFFVTVLPDDREAPSFRIEAKKC